MKTILIGGAGFIGSACVRRLMSTNIEALTVYDNFSSGRHWHLDPYKNDSRFRVVEGEVGDFEKLLVSMTGHDFAIHLASNPDIARAFKEPTIDFVQGTQLTQNIVEAARQGGVKRLTYASGSGVFGDDPNKVFTENDFSPRPTSTYAASKMAGEGLISAYSHLFGLAGLSYRFANVVGENQTHGVAYDFIKRLLKNPARLEVMGNGTQTKSYLHVEDVVSGLLLFPERKAGTYDVFNLTTDDALTVREIAALVIEELGLQNVQVVYGESDKGWPGDVPRIRFSSEKIKKAGWKLSHNSKEAMRLAIRGMIPHARAGRI